MCWQLAVGSWLTARGVANGKPLPSFFGGTRVDMGARTFSALNLSAIMCPRCRCPQTSNPDCDLCIATQQHRDHLRRHEMRKALKKRARHETTLARREMKKYLKAHEHKMNVPIKPWRFSDIKDARERTQDDEK